MNKELHNLYMLLIDARNAFSVILRAQSEESYFRHCEEQSDEAIQDVPSPTRGGVGWGTLPFPTFQNQGKEPIMTQSLSN